MARSRARRVTGALADVTGRSDDELRLVLTVAAVGAGLFALVRLINFISGLGGSSRSHPHTRPATPGRSGSGSR